MDGTAANSNDKFLAKPDDTPAEQELLASKLHEEAIVQPLQPAGVDKYKWDNEFLPNKIYGGDKWTKTAPDTFTVAEKLETEALKGLSERHKSLAISNDKENARVFPFKPEFTLDQNISARKLAEQQLGPQATKSQLEHYADLTIELNKQDQEQEHHKFKANSELKLPGQTLDGGLTSIDKSGNKKTEWKDGSFLLEKKDGETEAGWSSADNKTTLFTWNKKDLAGNKVEHIADNHERINNPDGSWVKQVRENEKSPWKKSESFETDSQGRNLHSFFSGKADEASKLILEKAGEKPQVFERNKAGELLSKDGSCGITEMGIVFKINKQADGSQERIHENGSSEKLDAKGLLVSRQGRDQKDRLFEESYKAGEAYPYKVAITINPGEAPTTFNRSEGGRYVAPFKVEGKPVGEIELNHGYFQYNNKAQQVIRAETFDGEKEEIYNLPFQKSKTVEADKNGKVVTEFDREGNKKTRTYTKGPDFSIARVYNSSGSVDTMTIESKLGHAELRNDRDVGKFLGEGTTKDGKTAGIYVSNNRLVYPAEIGDSNHSKTLVLPANLSELASPIEGDYDQNLRTIATTQHGHKQIESIDSGRVDIVNSDGSIAGHTANGEKSSILPSGEATVIHSDSAVRLNSDNTIDRWGPSNLDSARHEALSSLEKSFLDKNKANIDLRDLAEIHRRYRGDKTTLDGLYTAMSRIDAIPGFNLAEKQALTKNIMHQIANPADIYQGAIGTCNVAVIQRELAMTDPVRYINTLVDASSNTLVDSTTGKKVELDPQNLKINDLSERDLASRIFQSTALNLLFYPGKYSDTPDTNGKLYDHNGNLMPFAGLNMAQITELSHKLTGKEHSQVLIKSGEDLLLAFEKNGLRPMTISVDARKPPIVPTDVGTGGHVVTVTGVEKVGNKLKVSLQNQWGLSEDHSTPETEVDADALAQNMKDDPLAIILGAQGKVYKIEQGKFELDEDATRKQLANFERSMN